MKFFKISLFRYNYSIVYIENNFIQYIEKSFKFKKFGHFHKKLYLNFVNKFLKILKAAL